MCTFKTNKNNALWILKANTNITCLYCIKLFGIFGKHLFYENKGHALYMYNKPDIFQQNNTSPLQVETKLKIYTWAKINK